eukprot:15312449-Heterocapsa_arctica.AAC.1
MRIGNGSCAVGPRHSAERLSRERGGAQAATAPRTGLSSTRIPVRCGRRPRTTVQGRVSLVGQSQPATEGNRPRAGLRRRGGS